MRPASSSLLLVGSVCPFEPSVRNSSFNSNAVVISGFRLSASVVQSAVAGRGQMHSNRLNRRPSRTCFARRGFHLHRHFFRARRIIARGTAGRFDRFDRPARRPAARVVTESGRPRRTDLLDSSDEWEWPNGKECCPDPDKRLFRCLVSISDKRRQARNWISSKLRRSRVL